MLFFFPTSGCSLLQYIFEPLEDPTHRGQRLVVRSRVLRYVEQYPYGGATDDDVGSVNMRAYCGSPFSMDRSSYTILESENSYPCTLDILCEPLARES